MPSASSLLMRQGEEAKEQNRTLRKLSQELYEQLGLGHHELMDKYRNDVLTGKARHKHIHTHTGRLDKEGRRADMRCVI